MSGTTQHPSNVVCDGDRCYLVKTDAPADPAPAVAQDSPLCSQLGSTLHGKSDPVPTSSIAGPSKVVGLYFSAHWCPPCRGFTPQLAEMYKAFKASHARAADFEVVFVSSDRDEKSFNAYYDEMPWLALPYAERELKAKLSAKFKVQGIPTFVILDGETGQLITANGRNAVTEDPQGKDFPWRPQTFAQMMAGAELVNREGAMFKADELLKSKVTLLYFSAHWCGPCRNFTPRLVKTYEALKAAGKSFELVFVSGDRTEAGFKEYLAEMPWHALTYASRELESKLSSAFEVRGIPALYVLDEAGAVITSAGRACVDSDPAGAEFPWHPKPLNALDGASVDCLNEGPALVLVLDSDSLDAAAKAKAQALAGPTAEAAKAAAKAGSEQDGDVSFVYGAGSDGLMGRVLSFAGLEFKRGEGDKLFMLDVPSQVLYPYAEAGPITQEVVAKFYEGFKNGSLVKIPLERR